MKGEEKFIAEQGGKEILSGVRQTSMQRVSGQYFGRGFIDSIELMGKLPLTKRPLALVKKKLEADLSGGFDVNLNLKSDGRWTLDLGETFAKYGITTISSSEEGKIDLNDSKFKAKSSFYLPRLRDTLFLTVKGQILEQVQGTLLLEGDTTYIKISLRGSFLLTKK
ncbi:MAG: hypothetical protein GX046_00290 [Tissierellia bacterium]|nr:hypothetical protein [Tissierellia bacterium]